MFLLIHFHPTHRVASMRLLRCSREGVKPSPTFYVRLNCTASFPDVPLPRQQRFLQKALMKVTL